MSGEISEDKPPESLFPVQSAIPRNPLVKQDQSLLRSVRWPPAHQLRLREVPDDVIAPLTGGGDAGPIECVEEFVPTESHTAGERRAGDVPRSVERVLVQVEFSQAPRSRFDHSFRRQPEHPAEITRPHEMQRAANRRGPHHFCVVEDSEDVSAGGTRDA